jgi:hypothetical protein
MALLADLFIEAGREQARRTSASLETGLRPHARSRQVAYYAQLVCGTRLKHGVILPLFLRYRGAILRFSSVIVCWPRRKPPAYSDLISIIYRAHAKPGGLLWNYSSTATKIAGAVFLLFCSCSSPVCGSALNYPNALD